MLKYLHRNKTKIRLYEWLLSYVYAIVTNYNTEPISKSFEGIDFDWSNFNKAYHRAVVKQENVGRGCKLKSMAAIIEAKQITITAEHVSNKDSYWRWTLDLNNPFDERIRELCHPNWYADEHNPQPALGESGGPLFDNDTRKRLLISKGQWNAAWNDPVQFAQLKPAKATTFLKVYCDLLSELPLNITVDAPAAMPQANAVYDEVSKRSVMHSDLVYLSTYHGQWQLRRLKNGMSFFPIRYDHPDSSLDEKNLKQTFFLFCYSQPRAEKQGGAEPAINVKRRGTKAKDVYHLYEVELMEGQFTPEELYVYTKYLHQSATKYYRLLRIKGKVDGVLIDQKQDINALIPRDHATIIRPISLLFEKGVLRNNPNFGQMAAQE